MATKKAAKTAAKKKTTKKKKKQELVDDPPIIVGGGGSALTPETIISLPKGTRKTGTIGDYDIYRVAYDVRTITTKQKKNGTARKSKPENDTWTTVFDKNDV